jgi:hypothetical protein
MSSALPAEQSTRAEFSGQLATFDREVQDFFTAITVAVQRATAAFVSGDQSETARMTEGRSAMWRASSTQRSSCGTTRNTVSMAIVEGSARRIRSQEPRPLRGQQPAASRFELPGRRGWRAGGSRRVCTAPLWVHTVPLGGGRCPSIRGERMPSRPARNRPTPAPATFSRTGQPSKDDPAARLSRWPFPVGATRATALVED